VTNRHSHAAGRVALGAAGLSLTSLAALTACSGTSASTTAQGGVKEFAAEADGSIVVVVNADVNVATSSTFTRTKKIEKLLISKL
jgi:hypothetical protein